MSEIVVLGSGMAALGAAYRLQQEQRTFVQFDKGPQAGGHTKTYHYPAGWIFDDGPHVSFTDDPRIQDILAAQIDRQYHTVPTGVNNYWQGYWIKHPAQNNLHGLPTDLVVRCIADFIEASRDSDRTISNYEEWLRAAYGDTFAETFPMAYTRKVHTTDAANMTFEWMGPRMYRPTLEEVLRGAYETETPQVHYIDKYRYPLEGGFYAYMKRIHAASDLRLDHEVVCISPKERRIDFANGTSADYGHIVSSIPLTDLIPMIAGAPVEVVEAAATLAATGVVLVDLGIDRVEESNMSWTYFYDEDITVTRLSYPHQYAPGNVPDGHSAFQCEIYFSDKYKPLTVSPESLIDVAIADLRQAGVIWPDDNIVLRGVHVAHHAGIIFDHDRIKALPIVHGYLDELGIRYCGRYGDWGYLWTDHAFISGENAAQRALDGK
jgi:protoporphyrinogen oxidase